jgi:lipoate synthase
MNDVMYNGFRYTDDNAFFLANGDIVPKICPYCKTDVDKPETYLDDHEECFPC